MATVAGIKIKTKTQRIHTPIRMDEKYTGGEPQWPSGAAEWDADKFDNFLRRSFNYYNYHLTQRDCKKHVVEWMKTIKTFSRDEIKKFERSNDKAISMTACSLIMAHGRGMPLRPRHMEFLNQEINKAIKLTIAAEPEELTTEKKVDVLKPTIQDRLAERTSELLGELEGHYDDILLNVDTPFKPYDFLVSNNVVQSQLGKYEELFNKRKEELELAQSKTDDQLKESYKHYKVADFKKFFNWINDLLSAIEQYRGVKTATKKARIKKAPSKEKLISKLKYAKEDKQLKIVSINPADVVGASELWVYNNKTKKLGKYVAAPYQTLSVKGTSIVNFDIDKSIAKTLRKPVEQLKEFAKAGKIALRTFLKDVKAVEVKLNGRINEDILLIKVS